MCQLSADPFILSSAKFLLMISTDDGTFVFILLFIRFNVDTDAGFDAGSVPVRIFRMLSCSAFRGFRFGAAPIIYSSAKFRRRIPVDAANRFFCSVIPWSHCRD